MREEKSVDSKNSYSYHKLMLWSGGMMYKAYVAREGNITVQHSAPNGHRVLDVFLVPPRLTAVSRQQHRR